MNQNSSKSSQANSPSKRYKLTGHFIIEERKGFPVHSVIDFEADSNEEINEKAMGFLSRYDHNFCHSLVFEVKEK